MKSLIRQLRRIRYFRYQFFLLKDIYKASFAFSYRGIPTVKLPFDVTNYQLLLHDLKPDLILEIGTFKGGSSLFFADFLSSMSTDFEIHTIDVADYVEDNLVRNNSKIKRFYGGWNNYNLGALEGFSNILVIDDGSHSFSDVVGAFKKFSPFIRKGGFYVIEDAIVSILGVEQELKLEGGPKSAIEVCLKNSPEFEICRRYQDFWGHFLTSSPWGYLQKTS